MEWGDKELRNVVRAEVMQCFICNQQDLVVYSEFYWKPMEGCNYRGNVGPLASSG